MFMRQVYFLMVQLWCSCGAVVVQMILGHLGWIFKIQGSKSTKPEWK
jgi:hypothetical protein